MTSIIEKVARKLETEGEKNGFCSYEEVARFTIDVLTAAGYRSPERAKDMRNEVREECAQKCDNTANEITLGCIAEGIQDPSAVLVANAVSKSYKTTAAELRAMMEK